MCSEVKTCKSICPKSPLIRTGFTGITSSTTIINNNSSTSAPPITQTEKAWVYVRITSTDQDGTILKPFSTITAALNAITDASQTKPYNINVGAGIYTENVVLKPWIFLIAENRKSTIITGNVTLSPAFSNLGTRTVRDATTANTGIYDISLNGQVNFDLQTIGGTGSAFIFLTHCSCSNAPIWRARNDGDGLQIESSFLFSGLVGSGGSDGYISNTYSSGDISVDSKGYGGTSMLWEFVGVYFPVGNLNLSTSGVPFEARLQTANIMTGSLNASGTINVIADEVPIRTKVSLTSGATLTRTVDAFSYLYLPTNPVDWSGTTVMTIQQALDRIAAKIGPIP